MIISSVNFSALLPCLAVLCVLLTAGVAFMCYLLIRCKKENDKMMKNDVYTHDIDTLNADIDNRDDADSDNAPLSEDMEREEND